MTLSLQRLRKDGGNRLPTFLLEPTVALAITVFVFCSCSPPQHHNSPATALADLKARITTDRLYPWTTLDRLDVHAGNVTGQYVEVQVSEIHKGADGADPSTQPTVAFFRVDRRTGQWEVEWPAPGEGWIAYEAYRAELRRKEAAVAP